MHSRTKLKASILGKAVLVLFCSCATIRGYSQIQNTQALENIAPGNIIGKINSFDPTLTYEIVSGDPGGMFGLDQNGQVYLSNGNTFDYESQPSYSLLIQITDPSVTPPSVTQFNFNIEILDVNEAPQFTGGDSQNILEDAGIQSVVAWASGISDGDANTQSLQFNFNVPDPAFFEIYPFIDPATGELIFQVSSNVNGTSQIEVILLDDGGTQFNGVNQSAPQYFQINVQAVNDAPFFTKGTDIIIPISSSTQTLGNWAISMDDGDPETAQTLSFILSNNNNALFVIQPFIDENTLVFTPASGATGIATIYVQLKDNGGTMYGGINTSITESFTITISGANHAPSFSKGSDITVDEDQGPFSLPGWGTNISDGDSETQSLSFLVSNNNTSLFKVAPQITSDGTISFETKPDLSGTASVYVTLRDNGGTLNGGIDSSPQQIVSINVNPINDPPIFQIADFLQLHEDFGEIALKPITETVPGDELSQTVTYSISPMPETITFLDLSFNINTGEILISSEQDSSGSVLFTITANDGQPVNGEYTQNLYIEVLPENDPPILLNQPPDLSVLQDASLDFVVPQNTFYDFEDGYNLALEARMQDGSLLPNWISFDSTTKTLSLKPSSNEEGNYLLTLTARDKLNAFTQTSMVVNVNLITSLAENSETYLDIYPNPSTSYVKIHCSQMGNGPAMVKILSNLGEIIQSFDCLFIEGEFLKTIDVSNLQSGIYYIEVSTRTQNVVRALIKN